MRKQVVLKIYGKVHGVFFRESSQEKAEELNLLGWVRNEPDEVVRIVAEGEEIDLKELIRWCKDGPGYAKVDRVETGWMEPTGEFKDFEIK